MKKYLESKSESLIRIKCVFYSANIIHKNFRYIEARNDMTKYIYIFYRII